MHKVKVLVLGPKESGKTTIANYLSESTEGTTGTYHPTQGVRILEFEVRGISTGGSKTVTAEVEMWDCSGDHKFEQCWPAIAKDTSGAMFVFNPDQPNHDKDLESWYSYFVDQQNLRDNQCIVFSHNKAGPSDDPPPSLPHCMRKISCLNSNVSEDGEALRSEFESYLSSLLIAVSDKREQDELSIMQS